MTQRYVMLGAGGTGSHYLPPALTYLSAYYGGSTRDLWELGVIDGDNVERKNFDRQLFDLSTLHENKARAVIQPYSHMRNLIAIPEYLGAENISRYITDGSIVFIAVDNFPVRALIEDYGNTLDNLVVFNAGNERDTGSCQIWIRKNGKNETPPLSFLHPELRNGGLDRSLMSCQQIAEIPGEEQLIVTNMASAMHMLNALIAYHSNNLTYTELQFDLIAGTSYSMDLRDRRGWA